MNRFYPYSWGDNLKSALEFYAEYIVEQQAVQEFVDCNKSVKKGIVAENEKSLKELQRCDHWIAQMEKIQCIDLFAHELVGALTGSLPKRQDVYQFKGIIDADIFNFFWDCIVYDLGDYQGFCDSFPEWDGVKRSLHVDQFWAYY
jgi:hypothetical protein